MTCPLCNSKLLKGSYAYSWFCSSCPRELEFKSHPGNEIYMINIRPATDTNSPRGRLWLKEKEIHIWDPAWIKDDDEEDDADFAVKIPFANQSPHELIRTVIRVVNMKAFL